jgi:hypothetical protein
MGHTGRTLATIGLALLLVLAGCSGGAPGDGGSGGEGGDAARNAEGGAATEADLADGGDGGDGAGQTPSQGDQEAGTQSFQADRAVIRTGEVTLRVESFDAARNRLASAARARGGFVSDSTQRLNRRNNRSWTTGTVTFRVPADSFREFLREVKAAGVVLESGTSSRDVSDQLVDIEARLDNLEARRDRLRALYEDADTTEDVLAVGDRLSAVQEEIERLEARRAALEQRVALSTVTVTVREPEPGRDLEPEPETVWYDTGVLAAFLDSVDRVVTALRAVVVGLAYAAPYLLAFGLPVAGVALVLRRRGWPPL